VPFEIHVAVGVKITVPSYVTPCGLADGYCCFRQTSMEPERASFAPKLGTVASSEILFLSR